MTGASGSRPRRLVMAWRFHHAVDALLPVGAGVAALALYSLTLAPGLTWAHDGADGGDLLAAALTRGVPHPPGYPLYQLLLRLVIALAPGVEPARAGNWLSAACAAAAVALLADLAHRSLSSVPRLPAGAARSAAHATLSGWSPAVIAALAWAASPALWGQAVITEVYTLHALCVVSFMWFLWRLREAVRRDEAAPLALKARDRGERWLVLACLTFGLGLANHLSMALLLPGALAWLWEGRVRSRQTSRRTWLGCGAALAAGLGLYLYLPWAAAGRPPVNWGDPRSLRGLAWLVTAQPYRGLVFGLAPADLPGRLAAWAAQAVAQFWPWGAALALLGLWRLDRADHTWWRFTGLNALCISIYALVYNTADSYVYLIPAWAMAALWLAHGIEKINLAIRDLPLPGYRRWVPDLQSLVSSLLLILALPVASLAVRWPAMDLSRDAAANQFVEETLAAAQPGSVIVLAGDQRTFALWYAVYGLGRRPDLALLNANLFAYPWYRETLAGHHPALAAAAAGKDVADLPELLGRTAARAPLYRAEPLTVDTGLYDGRAAGPLVELLPKQ